MKKRNQVLDIYKVNTDELFKNDEDFLKEVKKLNKEIKEVSKYEGHILDDSKTLLELFDYTEKLDERIEKVYIYAHLNNDVDLSDDKGNENYGIAYKLYKE